MFGSMLLGLMYAQVDRQHARFTVGSVHAQLGSAWRLSPLATCDLKDSILSGGHVLDGITVRPIRVGADGEKGEKERSSR